MEKQLITKADNNKMDNARQLIFELFEFYDHDTKKLEVTIKNADALKDLSFKMKDAFKILDVIRLDKTKPLRDEVKVINDKFSRVLNSLDSKSKEIIQSVFEFSNKQARIIAENKRKELLAKIQQAQSNEAPVPAVTPSKEVAPPQAPPSISTRKEWSFTITSPKDVPRQYLKLDDAKVALAIKSGITKINGLHITSEEKPVRR